MIKILLEGFQMLQISNIRMILQFFRCNVNFELMFFNQTLNYKKELGSYSVGKIKFFGVGLDFALEPVYPFLSAVLSEPPIYLSLWKDTLRYQGTRLHTKQNFLSFFTWTIFFYLFLYEKLILTFSLGNQSFGIIRFLMAS